MTDPSVPESEELPERWDAHWSIFGPCSGGGYAIYFSGGRIWHHTFGDEAPPGYGSHVRSESLEEFAAGPRPERKVLRWLKTRGHLPQER